MDIAKILWLRRANCIEVVGSDGKKTHHSAKALLSLAGQKQAKDARIERVKIRLPNIILTFRGLAQEVTIDSSQLLIQNKLNEKSDDRKTS